MPSLNLDELCEMLWDMIRYANFDVESPYNREAANWAKMQNEFRLPVDPRPIRDRLATGEVLPDMSHYKRDVHPTLACSNKRPSRQRHHPNQSRQRSPLLMGLSSKRKSSTKVTTMTYLSLNEADKHVRSYNSPERGEIA